MAAPLIRLLIVVSLLLASAAAQAQSPQQMLARGKAEFDDLNYRQAIVTLKNLPDEPSLSDNERKDALELLGVCHMAERNEAEAEKAFRKLLKLDPDHQLRFHDQNPTITALFERLRKELAPAVEPIRLDHDRPGRVRAGKSVALVVRVVSGADQVQGVTIYYRGDDGRYRQVQTVPNTGERYRGAIPVPDDAKRLDYYLAATNAAGGQVATLGAADDPFSLPVGRGGSSSSPWYARWYVWVGGAALMAGGAALIVTQSGETPDGTLDPGRVTLTP